MKESFEQWETFGRRSSEADCTLSAQWGKARGQTLLLSFEPPPFGLNRISTDPGGLQKVKDLSCRVCYWMKAFVTAAGDVERELFFVNSLQTSHCVRIQDVVFIGQTQFTGKECFILSFRDRNLNCIFL